MALAEFLLWCLDQERFEAPSSCMDLLGALHHQGTLNRVLPHSAIARLQDRLARLAAEDREDLSTDLASLRGFWDVCS
jgi:hypothetical protein